MPTPTPLEDAQERARHVRALFDDEVFRNGVFEVEENLIRQWREGKTEQEREIAHARISALGYIMTTLRHVMETASFEKERDELAKKKKSSTSIV